MINIITPGEIVRGVWIIAYESMSFQQKVDPYTGNSVIEKVPVYSPWFKGVPYLVESVAGPIVAVKTFGLQNQPPIIFFDTRLVSFMEVEASFGDSYVSSMRPQVEAQAQPTVFAMPTLFNGNTNG